MIKILKYLFFVFVFLFSINSKVAAFEFVKSSSNPLPITFIQDYVYNFQAHIYKEGNLYRGILPVKKINQNNYSLVAIESTDGANWQMTKEIFINQGKDVSNPRLVIDKEGNKKIFFAQTDGPELFRIYSIDCDNNLNCSSTTNLVLGPDINNYTENRGFFAPYILNLEKYYLFYGAWGGNGFKIRLAYSDTLTNWQRCPNDLINSGADGPFPYIENNNLYLFYHQSNGSGIKLAKTTLPLSCASIFEDLGYQIWPSASYDQRHMIYPSVIKDNEGLMLYYTGLGSNYVWRLNVATTGFIFPRPTAIPTTTPTPTPTPIPEKTPIVIIPGFLASWNKEAILHNVSQPQSNWQLNPIVNEYKGIISTLKNLDYQENKDFFVFNYDWRKPVLEIVDDLNNFITSNKFPTTNFQILGHSLGGLVGRIYSQKYSNTNLDKLITVGSPHHGASQTYKISEAGEIDRFNDYLWLAVKMVTALNKNSLETDKQTVNRLFPVLKDLFPVYNFLKKDGIEINISDMKIKNELLSYYNSNLINLTNLMTVVGEKGNTLKGFNVENQTIIDKLLDNYPDGRPQSTFTEIGDYTVLSSSARINMPVILNLDHRELIYKKEAIKKILDLLNIQYEDSQVVEGKGTVIDSSLIFLIKSPATMEVVLNGQTYLEQEGIIFIENALSGDYQLKVIGKENGQYTVIVGQIGKEKDLWSEIQGEIVSSPPTSQIDSYFIKFDNNFPKPINNPSSLLDEIILDLNNFNSYNIAAVSYMRKDLKQAKKYLQNNDLKKLKSILLLAHSRLMIIRDKVNDENKKNIALSVFEKLENLFVSSLQDFSLDKKTTDAIITQNNGYKKLLNDQSIRLLNLQNKGKDISKQRSLVKNVNSKLLNVANYLKFEKYSSAEIMLKTVGYSIKEIKK